MFTKVDIFSHILTPKYTERFVQVNPKITKRVEYYTPPVVDLGVREKLMHRYPDVLQVITMANIPLEKWAPEHSVEMARIGNEEMAELVLKRPDLFFGAVAVLPINDIDASLAEIDYAINTLHLAGIQVQTRICSEWLASPKFRPIIAKMAELNKPIWIHPDNNDQLDNDIGIFSWPFETSHCMLRLVESGVFHEFPDIKFIIHHAGAMVPFFKERIKYVMSLVPQPFHNIHEHFKKFYVDTAIYGNTDGLMAAYNYYGADHMFFGTDAPLGPRWGMVEDTILSIERMAIPQEDKEKILRFNVVELFKDVV
jgi:predicted TIM-barrel fold metal-dependent hydrolase